MPALAVSACPCDSGLPYKACCGPLHEGRAAPDAAALMRSRYCAYVLAIEPYLLATWHASTRPVQLAPHTAAPPKWLGLEVRRHLASGSDTAIVEFVARYRVGGRAHRLHEVSRFVRENERWYYLDGDFPAATHG
ncbi:MAG: SEC-C domain-containing protein [Candidatus Accumulibacter sp.]|mgnify:CR=1 FL=1|uniref:YchJ family protein n=1 Tax=Accumulibacter sp. TaxID=2053492 RepID=UPI0019E102E4|nr:YchJ family metal-binding protein [Accumulibacter sp.]MBE2260326.1 SEC-C domain-containing protein [Paracoccaceae bacterium]MCP5247387.1 SEC-C domain-containing protein [Accumulibacter sp.]